MSVMRVTGHLPSAKRPRHNSIPHEPGAWKCACGFTNKADNTVCGGKGSMGCKAPKDDKKDGTAEWKCTCGFSNKSVGGSGQPCGGCKKPRDGSWNCIACGFKNRAMNAVCGGVSGAVGCKSPRDMSTAGGSWNCCNCGLENIRDNTVCGGAHPSKGCKTPRVRGAGPFALMQAMAPFAAAAMANAPRMQFGPWTCTQCSYQNREGSQVCGGDAPGQGCKGPRITPASQLNPTLVNPQQAAHVVGDGPWRCSCGFKNAGQNMVCGGGGKMGCKQSNPRGRGGTQKYEEPKVEKDKISFINSDERLKMVQSMMAPEPVYEPASSSAPQQIAGDWVCDDCGAKNGVSSSCCNRCKTPKPVEWKCTTCSFKNKGKWDVCGGDTQKGCRRPRPLEKSAWVCICGFKNEAKFKKCGGTTGKGCKSKKPEY